MKEKNASVIKQIAELERMDGKQLKDRWKELFGNEAPGYNKRFLVKRLAYKIQENAYGGLPEETLNQMKDILKEAGYDEQGIHKENKNDEKDKKPRIPVRGARLVREWKGETHEVLVIKNGFEYQGRKYKSLSAVAREITDTRWNGPKFFGLRDE